MYYSYKLDRLHLVQLEIANLNTNATSLKQNFARNSTLFCIPDKNQTALDFAPRLINKCIPKHIEVVVFLVFLNGVNSQSKMIK